MATSSSTDPVQTVIDLLDGTAASGWPNGTKPSNIEAYQDTDQRTRLNRANASVYVRTSQPGNQEPISLEATDKLQDEMVSADVYSPDSTEAFQVAEDVVAILEDYWNDANGDTTWTHGIRPQGVEDLREQHPARRSGQHVLRVPVRLLREAGIGTA